MRQRDLTVQNVVDLRRAVDVLRSRPQVDPHQIAWSQIEAFAANRFFRFQPKRLCINIRVLHSIARLDPRIKASANGGIERPSIKIVGPY